MTNAQAAIIAAALINSHAPTGRPLVNDAAVMKEWLDRQDAADQARIKVG